MSRTGKSHYWLVLIFFLAIGLYTLYQGRLFLGGPKLEIIRPETGSTAKDSLISVQGVAKNIARLYLNGRQIFSDQFGQFDEEVLLAYGYNILEVTAEDKFGRKTKKTVALVLK